MPALGDDDVGVAFARFDKTVMHRFDGRQVLIDDGVHTASALVDVATKASDKADVGVSVDENLYVKKVAKLLVFKNQYALYYDYAAGLFFYPVAAPMDGIVVGGVIDFLPSLEFD